MENKIYNDLGFNIVCDSGGTCYVIILREFNMLVTWFTSCEE